MLSPSKWALDGIFLMNHEKVMLWSSYSWLFSCPKIETFDTLMIFESYLWNHDQDLIKWWLCSQNNMLTKNWLLTVKWPFYPCSWLWSKWSFWLCNFPLWVLRLDIWMLVNVYRHMRLDWAIKNLKFTERTKTLILTGLGGCLDLCNPLRNLEPFEGDSW